MFVLMVVLFVVFCGRLTWEIAAFGAALSALVYVCMCKFGDFSIRKDLRLARMLPDVLRYLALLIAEIFAANLSVLKLIYTQKYEVEPVLVTFDTALRSHVARAVLADSITLTPGTITALCEEQTLTVHCLDKSMLPGLVGSAFEERLKKLERKAAA